MILSPEQLAALEAEVSTSMESVMIVWVDPEGYMSAVVLPYEDFVRDLVERAFERGEAVDGVGESVGEALVNLANGLIRRDAEMNPNFFEPEPKGEHD